MRLYSHGNPTAFVNVEVKSVTPVWGSREKEDNHPILIALRLELADGVTIAFLDLAEADMIREARDAVRSPAS
jgi:hypothetical protein